MIKRATAVQPPELPEEPLQEAYGPVHLPDTALLLYNLDQLGTTATGSPMFSRHPLPMEAYGLAFGMLTYTYAAPAAYCFCVLRWYFVLGLVHA